MNKTVAIPKSLYPIIQRAFALVEAMLRAHCTIYPFAAIKENHEFRCIFSDHKPNTLNPEEMIEILQWKLIDRVIDKPNQSMLVYAIEIQTKTERITHALAIDLSDENGNDYFLTFRYRMQGDYVVFSGPL